ncbi:MAG: SMC-Scp complex subunit ScpB [Clostridia bacterium]|nr:SMC-Scp complex subunit ScpB [Clostridia bacterium]MBR5746769.1 SMC-Scp complex subunit ScpB [Clostridia bacterium]
MNNETPAALEAVLFACGGPVARERLCEILEIDGEALREAVAALRDKYSDDRKNGIQLITVEDSYQLCTKAFVADYVKKGLEMRKTPPLSKASLEVLAIVAYNQPVTRSFIEMVRGVDSSSIVSSLVEKGLIAERGTLDAPGRPILFGTTDAFLRCFGLERLEDLPNTDLLPVSEQVSFDIPAEEGETAFEDGETAEGEE